MNAPIIWSNEAPSAMDILGQSVEYCCYGPSPEQATVIVLLHEGLGCVALWRDFPQRLSELTGCGVFVYSRLGYGQSDAATLPRPLNYMTLEAVDTLPVILDKLNADKVILMGHSDGASIAAIYAGSVADHRVRALILMAPHFFVEPISLKAIKAAKVAYETADLRGRLSPYHLHVDNAFFGWADAWLHSGFADWDITENIDYIRIPVLAIQGRQDQYGTLAQIEIVQERCYAPVEAATLEQCQHSPHIEQPQQVLEHVDEFVQRLIQIDHAR